MPPTPLPVPLAVWVPGFWELTLILLVFLLLFGAKKLPELARSMGTSITQFKRGLKEESRPSDSLTPPAGGESAAEKRREEEQERR